MQLNLGFSNQFRRVSNNLHPHTIQRMFRVSRKAFAKLALERTPHISKQKQEGTKFRSETLEVGTRLANVIRILAGGAIIDVMVTYGIGSATAYKVLHDTVGVLDRMLSFPKLPADEEGLAKVAREFKTSRQSQSPLDGCVGSLDGICIKIKKQDEESIPTSFFCRKGYYSIPVQAVCDSNYMFRYASGLCGGATHDALANAVFGFMEEVEEGLLGVLFWVAGDEAYPVSEYIIVPFPSPSSTLSEEESNFNFFLSSLRINIEQAIGMLMARQRILRDGLEFSLEHCSAKMSVAMKLHNFCIQKDSDRGRRGWDGVNSALCQAELASMEVDQVRYVRELREYNREVLRKIGPRRNVAGQTRSSTATRVRSENREVLRNIVTEKGLIRPN